MGTGAPRRHARRERAAADGTAGRPVRRRQARGAEIDDRRPRARLPAVERRLRRQLRQQRMAPGAARARQQAHVGQRGHREQDRRRRSRSPRRRSRDARARRALADGGGAGVARAGDRLRVDRARLRAHRRRTRRRTASASTPTRSAPPKRSGSRAGSRSPRRPARTCSPSPTSTGAPRAATSSAKRTSAKRDTVHGHEASMGEQARHAEHALVSPWEERKYEDGPAVGHDDRPERVHRLQRLRRRLPEREQHPVGRQGPSDARPRDALDPHRSLLLGASRGARVDRLPAGALHALRERAVRAGLPGGGDRARRERPQRDGLQPLHRHAVLLEQLSRTRSAASTSTTSPRTRPRRCRWRTTPTSRCAPAASWRSAPTACSASRAAQRDAKLADRALQDGEIRTACQQSCPAQAIEFGDIRDAKSRVAAAKASPRRYDLLGEFNTKPRTSYLSRLRNPNPELSA